MFGVISKLIKPATKRKKSVKQDAANEQTVAADGMLAPELQATSELVAQNADAPTKSPRAKGTSLKGASSKTAENKSLKMIQANQSEKSGASAVKTDATSKKLKVNRMNVNSEIEVTMDQSQEVNDLSTQANGSKPAAERSAPSVTHEFYVVGGDLLDKTNALSAVLEMHGGASGGPKSLIFCHSKADADLVEVVLNKRGFKVYKPNSELSQTAYMGAMKQLNTGEISVIAVTDTTSKGFEGDNFELVVNYSVPSEPEVYLHRIGEGSTTSKLQRVVSLVGPNDKTNFEFIVKVVGLRFEQRTVPSATELSAVRLNSVFAEAVSQNKLADTTIAGLVQQVLQHTDRDQMIGLLLHNTLIVLPSLKRSDDGDDRRGASAHRMDRDSRDDRDSRGGRDGRRGRGDRGDRRDGGERRDRGGRYGDREESDSYRSEGRQSSDRQTDNGGEDEGRYGDRRRGRPEMAPPTIDARLYLGHGSSSGFNQNELSELVSSKCSIDPTQVKRFSLRDKYSFIDVPNEVAEQLLNGLSGSARSNGEQFFIRRATTITSKAERAEGEQSNGDANSSSSNDSASENSEGGYGDELAASVHEEAN